MHNRKSRRKIREKVVSHIVASLLLILVAVGSSLAIHYFVNHEAVYAKQSGNTVFPVIKIEAVKAYRGHILIFARNIGDKPYTIDRVYLYHSDGTLVSTGTPVTPTNDIVIPPRSVKTILYYTGVLPDGLYRVKIAGHGSPEAMLSTSLIELKLSSAEPPIIVNEFYPGYQKREIPVVKLESSISGGAFRTIVMPMSIELYNPSEAPINITKYMINIYYYNSTDSSLLRKVSFRILDANPPKAEFYSSHLCFREAIPSTTVIEPNSYLVLNFTESCIVILGGSGSSGSQSNNSSIVISELRIIRDSSVIDDTGNFTFYVNINGTYVMDQNDTAQRIGERLNPHWILAPSTLGYPNRTNGTKADA